jgi:hypothetical protein
MGRKKFRNLLAAFNGRLIIDSCHPLQIHNRGHISNTLSVQSLAEHQCRRGLCSVNSGSGG